MEGNTGHRVFQTQFGQSALASVVSFDCHFCAYVGLFQCTMARVIPICFYSRGVGGMSVSSEISL